MAEAEPMLQLQGVSRRYRVGEVETQAVVDASLTVAAGEFVAVTGPSGCGKSTLLNLIGLLDSLDSGSYRLAGEEVATLTEARRTRLRRDRIGFVFQSFNLIDELTVAENVEVGLVYRGGSLSPRRRAHEMLETVGMTHRAHHRPRQLSGGQQQRLAIARALAAAPAVLLADEPTGNLDSTNGAAVTDLLKRIASEGTTVVMVTHSPLHAAAADRSVAMLDGRIVGEERP